MQAETGSIKGDTPSLPVIVVLSSQEGVCTKYEYGFLDS